MTGTARPALRDHPTGRAYHADQLLSPLPPGLPPEVARPNGWGPDGAGGYGREKIGRCRRQSGPPRAICGVLFPDPVPVTIDRRGGAQSATSRPAAGRDLTAA
jgi:hypothetical protein